MKTCDMCGICGYDIVEEPYWEWGDEDAHGLCVVSRAETICSKCENKFSIIDDNSPCNLCGGGMITLTKVKKDEIITRLKLKKKKFKGAEMKILKTDVGSIRGEIHLDIDKKLVEKIVFFNRNDPNNGSAIILFELAEVSDLGQAMKNLGALLEKEE